MRAGAPTLEVIRRGALLLLLCGDMSKGIETVAEMLGTERSREYCLEMIWLILW